jgi:signal transduction histidine kinase
MTDGALSLARDKERAKEQVLTEAQNVINLTLARQEEEPEDPEASARAMRYFNPEVFSSYQAGDTTMIYGLLTEVFARLYSISAQLITLDGEVQVSDLPEGVEPEDFPPPIEGERFQVFEQLGPLSGHFIAWYIDLEVPVTGQKPVVTWILDRTDAINRIEDDYRHEVNALIFREVIIGGGILILSLLIVLVGIRLLSRRYIVGPMRGMQDKLMRAERLGALGALAGSVSHEMRNPLNVIKSSAFYLRGRLGDKDEKVVTHLDRVERSIERADNIINDLLSFSRITAIKPLETDARRLVETIVSELQAPEGVNVAIKAPEDMPAVRIDPLLFGQVLNNLLLNSFQAMPEGGTVEIELAREEQYFKTTVRDDGIGVSAENLPKIFEPLFSTKAVGTGFGLAVCKRNVEEQGGTIEIESEEGRGTRVTVRLPLDGGD